LKTHEILEHLNKKDKRAFLESIYSFKEDCVIYLFRGVECKREVAEDIFIDAVMTLWEKSQKDGLEEIKELKGYLFRTCYLIWMNAEKEKIREATTDLDRYYYEYRRELEIDEEDTALLKERLHQVSLQALKLLDEGCQKILIMCISNKRAWRKLPRLGNSVVG